jgi:hypothetical protein
MSSLFSPDPPPPQSPQVSQQQLEIIIDHGRRSPARDNKNRTRPSTAIYRALMVALDDRRVKLDLSMERVNDLAGLQDGFWAKMADPDTEHGRQSKWESVDLVVEALFGTDYEISIKPRNYRNPPEQPTRAQPSAKAARPRIHWRHRKIFAELGKKGGKARREKYKNMRPEERRRIAKKALKTRRTNRALRAQLKRISGYSSASAVAATTGPDLVKLPPVRRGAARATGAGR